jgi:16S rRNA (adenine1518-N6/adenine1519-N6)-dimethyltransferase
VRPDHRDSHGRESHVSGPTEDEPARRAAWREWRERLAAVGFHPSRRLGQNFLLDENLARALVRDAGVSAGDFVLEVGPGLGFLTRPLLDTGAQVLAVEIDERLAGLLGDDLGAREGFEVIECDVLAGKHRLEPQVQERLPSAGAWKLVANLPYAVSAPVLVVLGELENPPSSIDVLVQLEVAERLCAAPGDAAWGPISARLQAAYRARLGRRLGPAQFWPRPRVDSAVCHLERRASAPSREELAALSRLVAALFQRRRQKLGRVLGDHLGDRERALDLLGALAIDAGLRAEVLEVETLLALSARVDGT